jgi:hypothetical protein
VIEPQALLADLTRQLKAIEGDLRQRIEELPELKASLQAEWQAARDAERCAETFESWAEQLITQAGVHWLLSCVFLRFIEDNALVERPWLSGTAGSGRMALARDRFEAWQRARPTDNDRSYLLEAFQEAGALPGLQTFFDPAHNPVFRFPISADAAMALRQFWLKMDPDSGALRHDFTDLDWNTRFLGDVYQDLSEATRKRYALLQTPEFVERFILDRTLTPAIHTFGFREVRLIDPTCGSGHFLLGAFDRLVAEWQRSEPGRNPVDVAQKALDAVAGVDLNPFAVAIARFRLWVAALKVAGVQRLAHAPNFKLQVAIGDSLLHGTRFGLKVTDDLFDNAERYQRAGIAHAYASEDLEAVNAILGRQYHAVVGNPPYIVVKDKALNQAYRDGYASCHMKYSLGAPFTERFFELALSGDGTALHPGGYVGEITSNSFMKREFGGKLIEQVLPQLDLTHVIDTAGAYIPGHGTPTVILFGRHQRPVSAEVRTVMGIKGEPSTPDDPAQGLVWTAILDQVDRASSESDFVSVTDTSREVFGRHPWSIGGGGAADLKEILEDDCPALSSETDSIGITSFTLEDEVFVRPLEAFVRSGYPESLLRMMISGDELRDWSHEPSLCSLFPYDAALAAINLDAMPEQLQGVWPFRTTLSNNKMFGGKTKVECGLKWWEFGRLTAHKLRTPLTITFAEVATHNHYVLDRGGKVFNRTAPVIKLPAGSSEDTHLGLLGLLNSSVACFWLKQVCHNKGSTVDQHGARQRTAPFEDFYAFNSTKVAEFPLTESRPLSESRTLDVLAREHSALLPAAILASARNGQGDIAAVLDEAAIRAKNHREQMIAAQEELDWACYALYGLLRVGTRAESMRCAAPPPVRLGERAFEIVLARRMAAGSEQSTWFERHGSTPITELPAHWPADYRAVVERRIALIEADRSISLIERPEYKRRWNDTPWAELQQAALRDRLLDRLESEAYWPPNPEQPQILSTWRLSELARRDHDFLQVAAVYRGEDAPDLHALVSELVAAEAVPSLPAQRYTDTGLRKRAQWEATWDLQRREDAGEDVGRIPVPPKYQSKDFSKPSVWKLRGALDVPKERWVSYPGCERGADASLPILWAGWNHLQQALAVAAYYMEMKDTEGWPTERLIPLLAALQQLVPWLKQWHNDLDSTFGERMGDYYAGFLADEARSHGLTLEALAAWTPPAAPVRRGRRARS